MRPHAELITSTPAGDPNINFVKIDFLQNLRRLKLGNALMRTKAIKEPSV